MKNLISKFSLIGMISIALFSTVNGQTKRTAMKTVEPTVKEALKQIFLNGNIQLSSMQSCKTMKTAETDKTLFDYLGEIMANQSKSKTTNSLEYKVKAIKGKKNANLWEATIIFKSIDEESGDPWNNGFRFLMQPQNNLMIRNSLQCVEN